MKRSKCSLLSRLLALLLCSLSLWGMIPLSATAQTNHTGKAQNLFDEVLNYKLREVGASSPQEWLQGGLSHTAGTTAEWYVLGLAQKGSYDFSFYEKALLTYLKQNPVYAASSRQKYALTLIAIGSADPYIAATLEDSIGKQGVMSWIYGLHLLHNGYTSTSHTKKSIKQKLLSLQLSDGGWAVTGNSADVDVTAMVIQALAPFYAKDRTVRSSVDRALSLLSSRQLADADFASYGKPNVESTCQVITALAALGIDTEDDRFIRNGNTLWDGVEKYQRSDGSFAHLEGQGSNENATAQVFYTTVAYLRMKQGKPAFYLLDHRDPSTLKPLPSTESTPDNATDTQGSTSSKNSSKPTAEADRNTADDSAKPVAPSVDTATSQNAENTSHDTKDNAAQTSASSQSSGSDAYSAFVQEDSALSPSTTPQAQADHTTAASEAKQAGVGYKFWVILAILLLVGIVCLILVFTHKLCKKNLLPILAVALAVILFVLLTHFQSADDFYQPQSSKQNTAGSVTLSISCASVAGEVDLSYIPENGILLEPTVFAIEDGDTVYDILMEAAQTHHIQLEHSGSAGMIYVVGIGHLYEFDFGDLSGWTYKVNGETLSAGCDAYILSDGDQIEWLYTKELGRDLS